MFLSTSSTENTAGSVTRHQLKTPEHFTSSGNRDMLKHWVFPSTSPDIKKQNLYYFVMYIILRSWGPLLQTNKLDLLISVICFLNSTVSCTLDLNGRPCYATKYDCQLNNLIFSQMMFFGEAWESVKFILLWLQTQSLMTEWTYCARWSWTHEPLGQDLILFTNGRDVWLLTI